MLERLIYTNSAGKSVEFSTSSIYHVNVRKDVSGLFGVKTTIFSSRIVDVDGEIETGFHVEMRDIDINGVIKSRTHTEQDELTRELISVLSPFYTGTLRHEGEVTREIDVRVEVAPDPQSRVGQRWPTFSISLVALDPNWRSLSEKEVSVSDTGTTIYYAGTKACGIEIEITALEDEIDMDSLTVTNGSNVETITFRNAGGVNLVTDDVLLVDTTAGGVIITLNDSSALARVDFNNTVFPRLYPGTNIITWDVSIQAYSAAATYSLGDFVSYSGAIYECTTPIASPEAWTAGHWTEVALADLFTVTVRYTPQYIAL